MTKTVRYKGVELPVSFFENVSVQQEDSPAAVFNVSTAEEGKPWQNTTPPQSTLVPKVLVITHCENDSRIFYMRLFWLNKLGFRLYAVCTNPQGEPIVEVINFEPSASLTSKKILSHLRFFKSNEDYLRLAELPHQIARDNIHVIKSSEMAQLAECMDKSQRSAHNAVASTYWQEVDYPIKVLERIGINHLPDKIEEIKKENTYFLSIITRLNILLVLYRCINDKVRVDLFNSKFFLFIDHAYYKEIFKSFFTETLKEIVFESLKNWYVNNKKPLPINLLMAFIETTNNKELHKSGLENIKNLNKETINSLLKHTELLNEKIPEAFFEFLNKYKEKIIKEIGFLSWLEKIPDENIRWDFFNKEIPSNIKDYLNNANLPVFPLFSDEHQLILYQRYKDIVSVEFIILSLKDDMIKLNLYNQYKSEIEERLNVELYGIINSFVDDNIVYKLHNEIKQKYAEKFKDVFIGFGGDFFVFQVLERCDQSMLLEIIIENSHIPRCLRYLQYLQGYEDLKLGIHNKYFKTSCDSYTNSQYFSEEKNKIDYIVNKSTCSSSNNTTLFSPTRQKDFFRDVSFLTQALVLNHLLIIYPEFILSEFGLSDEFSHGFLSYHYRKLLFSPLKINAPRPWIIHLSIWADGSPRFEKLLQNIDSNNYPNLAFLDIQGGDEKFIKKLLETINKRYSNTLHEIRLYISSQDQQAIYTNFVPDLSLTFSDLPDFSLLKVIQSEPAPTPTPFFSIAGQPTEGGAFLSIHQNLSLQKISSDEKRITEPSHYTYVKVAEILNPCGEPRQQIITSPLDIDFNTLYTSAPTPRTEQLIPKPLNFISPAQIFLWRNSPLDADGRYIKFNLKITPGITFLLSVDPNEQFMGYCGSLPNGVKLYRVDNIFHYLESPHAFTFSYVVKALTPSQQNTLWQSVSPTHPAKIVVKDYTDEKKGYKPCTLPTDKIPTKKKNQPASEWFQALYNCRGGTCEMREAAVAWKLKTQYELRADEYMSLVVDNNHNRLAIRTPEGRMIMVEDLGGIRNAVEKNAPSETIYTPKPMSSAHGHTDPEPRKNPLDKILQSFEVQTLSPTQPLEPILNKVEYLHISLGYFQPEELLQFAIHYADHNQRLYYILDKQGLSALEYLVVHLQSQFPSDEPVIADLVTAYQAQSAYEANMQSSAFKRFLQQASRVESGNRPLLIIRWETFSIQEQIILNTVMDIHHRSIQGYLLPSCVQILNVYSKLPEDSALLSRAQFFAQLPMNYFKTNPPLVLVNSQTARVEEVHDGCGFFDWKAALFGSIVLVKKPVWLKSKWIKKLNEAASKPHQPYLLKLYNLPPEVCNEAQQWFSNAKFHGYGYYKNYRISIPQNMQFQILITAFDFSALPAPTVYFNCLSDKAPADSELINHVLFDYVWHQKSVQAGTYIHQPGWLLEKRDHLNCWITTPLSANQWYILLAQADLRNVALTLYLAPGVTLPSGLKINERDLPTDSLEPSALPTIVLATKITNLEPIHADYILDLDDEPYLFGHLDFEATPNGFEKFIYSKPDLVQLLKSRDRNSVCLRGRFSMQWVNALQPLLCGKSILLPDGSRLRVFARLTIVIEMETLPNFPIMAGPLACLANISKELTKDNISLSSTVLYDSSIQENPTDVTFPVTSPNIIKQAEETFRPRLQALQQALQNEIILHIQTEQTDQTLLLHALEESMIGTTFYYGLNQLSDWAQHEGTGAILVLENIHVYSASLGFLRTLHQNKGTGKIYHQGHLYTLTSPHKVIAISSSRTTQLPRVFKECTPPVIKLGPLPPAVIYYYHLLPRFMPAFISYCPYIQNVEKHILDEFMDYVQKCQQQNYPFVWSELEQILLKKLHQQIIASNQNQSRKRPYSVFENQQHISDTKPKSQRLRLPSQNKLREEIQQLIHYSRLEQTGQLLEPGLGKTGCFIMGPAGLGKSYIIKETLEENNYELRKNLAQKPRSSTWYCKIDASSFLQNPAAFFASDPFKLMCQAVNEGQFIWIDEFNTSCEENQKMGLLFIMFFDILHGRDPVTHQPANKAGAKLLLTGNGIEGAGRTLLSPVLAEKCLLLNATFLTAQDVEAILQYKYPAIARLPNLAKDLSDYMQKNPHVNLRTLLHTDLPIETLIAHYPPPAATATPQKRAGLAFKN